MFELSKEFGEFCVENSLVVATAESCTAGLIAATIAQTPGSSAWLESGFVVYTARAKNKMLGVNPETIKEFNITSVEVSSEMAWGALERTSANVIMAVTGVAGPAGGTNEIPVGTVCMSWIFKFADCTKTHDEIVVFKGDRNQVREEVVEYMLRKCISYYEKINE